MPGIEWTSSLDYTGFADGMKKIQQSIAETAATVDRAGGSIESMFNRIAGVAGVALSVDAAKGFVNQVVQMRSFFQDIESSMKVFLGSAEKGAEFTQKLKDYAYYNMFEFKDLAAASQQMIAYGHDIDTIIPRLDQLSNVAVGTHGNIMELVSAYNKAKSTGVVDAQGMASWATKGIVIKDVLKEMGVQANSSRVTFEQLNMVLDHVTGEGGMFHDLQLSMMENISAEQGQLDDNINSMLNEIGEKYQDIIIKWYRMHSSIADSFVDSTSFMFDAAAGVAEFLIDHYEAIGRTLLSLVSTYGAYRAALMATRAVESSYQGLMLKEQTDSLTEAIDEEKKAINELKKAMGELVEEDLKEAVAKGQLTEESAKALEAQREELSEKVQKGELSTEGASQISERQKELAILQQMRQEQEELQQKRIGDIEAQIDANNEEIESFRNGIEQKKKELDELEEIRKSYQDEFYGKEFATDAESYASPEFKAFQEANDEYEEAKAAVEEYTSAAEESISSLIEQNEALDVQAASIAGNTASEEGNSVAKGTNTVQENANTVGKTGNTAATTGNTVAEEANTVATGQNTIAQRLNMIQMRASTAVSRIWTVAVGQMRAAFDGLKVAIMTNPIGVLLGGIALVLPWIMEWVSGTEDAEESTDAYANTAVKAAGKLNYYLDVLETCSSSTSQYKEAMSELKKAYEEYGIELDNAIMSGDDEAAKIKELKKHHEELTDVLKLENIERQKAHDIEEAGKEREGKDEDAMRDAKSDLPDDFSKEDKNALVGLVSPEIIEQVNQAYAKYLEYANKRREMGLLADDKEIQLYNDYQKAIDGTSEGVRRFCEALGYSSTATSQAEKVVFQLTNTLAENKREEDEHARAAEQASEATKKAVLGQDEYSRQLLDSQLSVENLKKELADLANTYGRTQLRIDIVYNEHNIPDWMKKFDEKGAKHNAAFYKGKAEKAYKSGDMEKADEYAKRSDQYSNQAEYARRERERKERRQNYTQRIADAKTRDDINGAIRDLRADQGKVEIGSEDDKFYTQAITQLQNKLPSSHRGGGRGKGGRGSGHDPAVDAAKERQRLFKQQMEEEERLAEERQKKEDAIEDAAVAAIANSGERERTERQVQHERNMRQIDEQEESFKKAAYKRAEDEFNATNKDKKKVFSDTEVGAAGWQGMVLSEDQQRLIQAQRDKENAEYQGMLDERRRQESQYLIDYIKEYGSIQDRKAAITKEYDQKIAEESNAIQKAALEKEKQQAISDLNFKEWQQSIDWEAVFNDLDRQSTSALKELKDKLRSALSADDITAENAKVLAEKIRETEDLLSRRKNPIAAWLPGMRERVRLSNEAKVAEEELAAATERRNELLARQAKLSMQSAANILQLQEKARSLAKATGRNISDKDITADKIMSMTADDWVRLIGLDPISEQAKNVREEFSKLVVTSYDLEKAQEDVRKAQENAAKRRDAFSEFTKGGSVGQYFKDITAGMDFAGWSNYISQQARGMSELVDNIGLGSTEFGEKVHDFADGVGGFNSAVQSLASGDVFGAINGVIDGFQGFGHMLGIGGGNSKEVMTTIERLTQRNEILTQSIDNLTEAMQKSSGENAILQYEKLVESQKELNENLLKQLTEQMRYHNAHGSFNSYWGGFSDSDIADFNRRNGTSWNGDLSTLTPEIAKMLMGSPDMWEQIMETGKGGYGERVAERIQALAEQAGLLDEYMENLRETITGTSFDNVFSDFMSALNDLANGSEDVFENVAENWEKMMNQMVLNNLVGNKYKEKLREWYEQWDAIYNTASGGDGNIDPEEIANLRRGYNEILQQAADEVNTLKESGLLTSPDAMNAQEQSASVTAMERITTDQAEEIIGRLNVGQILWQQHKDISAQILTNITAMNDLVSGNRQSLTEIVTILQTTNGTLATMLTVNKKIYDEFGLKLDDISQHIRDSYA